MAKNKFLAFILAALFVPVVGMAQNDNATESAAVSTKRTGVYRGYSGGMMLHLGYHFGEATGFQDNLGNEAVHHSITYGIGGALRIHLLNHLRVGTEGYASTMPLFQQGTNSNIHYGWGGLLADAYTTIGKVQLFAGGTIGGGSQKITHVYGDNVPNFDDWKDAWEDFKDFGHLEETHPAEFTKRGFFAVDPFVGMEFILTQKIHLIVKADYLIALHKNRFLTPSGPRLYLGFMFTH